MKYSLTRYLAIGRDVGKKGAGISHINRAPELESRRNRRRSYRGHFSSLPLSIPLIPLHISSILPLSLTLSSSFSRSLGCFFRIPPLFPPVPLTCLLPGPLQLYRSGRGCSDPRRRSSESLVVATPYLLSHPSTPLHRPFSFIWQTVYIFHRLEILFARTAAKLSRFEIFMNGSLRGSRMVPPAVEQRGVRP